MFDDAVAPAAPTAPPEATPPEEESVQAEASPAVTRFRSCRWHEQKDGAAEYCSHPDVLPYAGRNGFHAEAWCPECTLYKARRNARKRDPDLDY